MKHEVVIIGAGPAGAVAAFTLAQAGVPTLLLERRRLPREKVCGDGLIPDSIAVLTEIGLWPTVRARAHAMEGCRIYVPDGTHMDIAGPFATLPRRELDHLLVQHATAAGAELRDGVDVIAYQGDADGARLRVKGPEGERDLDTRLVILATGANPTTLDRFGVLDRRAASATAMRTYYRLRDDVDTRRIHIWFEEAVLPGYGWIFPMGDGVYNVGAGVFHDARRQQPGLKELLQRFLTQVPQAREMLDGGQALAPFKGAPLRTGLRGARPSGQRLLVAGEAVGTTYSFSGEGIGKAMETGRMAGQAAARALSADALQASDLEGYAQALRARYRDQYRQYEIAQRWLRWPWVCNLVARRARKSPRVSGILEDVLNERLPPTEILSPWGLIRTLLG